MAKYNSLTLGAKVIYTFPDGTPNLEQEFEFDATNIPDMDGLMLEAIEQIEKLWDEANVSVEITDYKDVHKDFANEEEVWEYATVWKKFNYDQKILNAGIQAGVSIDDVEEAYAGTFSDDEEFAQDMAEQIGAIDKNAKWPMNCIDWEVAAKELMFDYTEEGGHYFRNF